MCLSDRFLHERSKKSRRRRRRRRRRRKTGSEWAKTMTICVSKQSTSEIAPALLFFFHARQARETQKGHGRDSRRAANP
jgi:hypothetical protein